MAPALPRRIYRTTQLRRVRCPWLSDSRSITSIDACRKKALYTCPFPAAVVNTDARKRMVIGDSVGATEGGKKPAKLAAAYAWM